MLRHVMQSALQPSGKKTAPKWSDQIVDLDTVIPATGYNRSPKIWFEEQLETAGFDNHLVFTYPTIEKQCIEKSIVSTSWPSERIAFHKKMGPDWQDRILESIRCSRFPSIRTNAELFPSVNAKADATGFYSKKSVVFNIFSHSGSRFVFVLTPDASQTERVAVVNAYVLAMRYVELVVRQPIDADAIIPNLRRTPLKSREIECLKWASLGKTTEEISIILGISSHTINEYFQSSIAKLSTVNRTQAVATAIRLGLF
jgi:DNA-binding CsgD family transcriptional regulator